MSQSGASSSSSPGSTFASENGPWPSYLGFLKEHGNKDAGWLLYIYADRLWNVHPRSGSPVASPAIIYPDLPFARILDIEADDTVQIWSTITFGELHNPLKQATEVDRFIASLSTCGPDVNSRLLVLNNDFFDIKGEEQADDLYEFNEARNRHLALQDLLIAHILGIEYDLSFSEVHRRLRTKFIQDEPERRFHGLGYTGKDMLFYCRRAEWQRQLMRAYTLGPRSVDSRTIEHNVIQFTSSPGRAVPLQRPDIVDTWSCSTRPSEVAGLMGTAPRNSEDRNQPSAAAEVISSFLDQGDWKALKPAAHLCRTHWLDAILRWIVLLTERELERLSVLGPVETPEFVRDRRAVQSLANVLQSTTDEVDTFLEQHPAHHRADCQGSLRRLERLEKVASNFARVLIDAETEARTKRQMEMTELSITESKSAIALTVLAAVFVPVSLASSIFGMNIQQINHTGHGIWAFVVCALTMWLVTAAVWLAWQVRRNLAAAKRRILSGRWRDVYMYLGLSAKVSVITQQYRGNEVDGKYENSLPYWLGLRRFDKAAVTRV